MTGTRRALVLVTSAVVLTAVAWGIIWGLVTPGIDGRIVESGYAVAIGDATTEFSAIAIFFCVALGCGVVLAVVIWMAPLLRGPLGVVALTGGALAAGVGAVWVGDAVARVRFSGRDGLTAGAEFTQPPSLRISGAELDIAGGVDFSWALLVIAPLSALLTFMLLIALERGTPRRDASTQALAQ